MNDLHKQYDAFMEEIKRVRALTGLDLNFGLRHYYNFVFPVYEHMFNLTEVPDWETTIMRIEKLQELVKHEANRDSKNPILMLEWISDYVKCIDAQQKFLLSGIENHEKEATDYLHSKEGK